MSKLVFIHILLLCGFCAAACQTTGGAPEAGTGTAMADAVAQAVATANSLAATATAVQATIGAAPTATPTITATPDPFPTPVIGKIYVAEQRFEGGWLFWLQPNAQIWLLSYNDTGNRIWTVYDDTFVEGDAETDPQIIPPDGRFQPVRGFGKLWRENPEVRQTLGWAIELERGHTTRYEYHHGGGVNAENVYEPAPGYHLVESATGDTYRFYEDGFTWLIES